MSLVLAFGVAALGFLLWQFWQQDEIVDVGLPPITTFEYVYKCKRNHTFCDFPQVGPRRCPICGQPTWPRSPSKHECETHGRFEVELKAGVGTDGELHWTHHRLPGREWVPVGERLRCPRCNEELRPAFDPLDSPLRCPEPED